MGSDAFKDTKKHCESIIKVIHMSFMDYGIVYRQID